MTNWYDLNYTNPYPTFPEIEYMATQGQITINQVKQWFVNIRRRTQNEYRKKRTNLKKTKQSNDSSSFSSTNTFETTFELEFNPNQLDNQCKISGLDLFNSSPQSICNANNYSFLPNYQNYGNVMHSTPIFNNYQLMNSNSSNGNSSSSLENVSSAISSSSSSLTNVSTYTYNQFYYQGQFNNENISPLQQNYRL